MLLLECVHRACDLVHELGGVAQILILLGEDLVLEDAEIGGVHDLSLQGSEISKGNIEDDLVTFLAVQEEQIQHLQRGCLWQALSVQADEPADRVVHEVELDGRVVKLGLDLGQEAVLTEDLLQDGSLRTHTIHLYIVVGWHIRFNDHDQGPKGVLLVEHLAQPEHQEVKSLDIADRGISPNVCLYDSRD